MRQVTIIAAIIAIIGGIPSAVFWWPSPTNAEFQVVDGRSRQSQIRWLLQDKFNAMLALQQAKAAAEKQYWESKIETINIQIKRAVERDRK